ncbi:CBS domain-containing protein [Bacillus piscicola]|uniref:CBS domain-containing protein n=1 Tax=Bacillus piscicola TaxID=1632684 RepID=UPI001F09847C|nr:CBS domain-containing protein [Bacillus piscicola]
MKIILTHDHMDFDALASLVAASKLYPAAKMLLPKLQSEQVKKYLAIYRDSFAFSSFKQVDWEETDHLILTDVASVKRTEGASKWKDSMEVTVYDHHPLAESDKEDHFTYHIHHTGAAVTILIEEIIKRNIPVAPYEATLFALGLYTDTGSFTYPHTTIRDLKAALFLMEKGMQLDIVRQFSEESFTVDQQEAFQSYLNKADKLVEHGVTMIVSSLEASRFVNNVNSITARVLETTGADAVITVTNMQNKVFVIGRSATDRINLLPLMKRFHGGGHPKAASASIKHGNIKEITGTVKELLPGMITVSVCAEDLMSAPVKTITEEASIDKAKQQMLYYGHNGFPVVDENGKLTGIISRRDIDKAAQHGYGHSPVKAYMSTDPVTISKATSFERIQQLMIQHNIGRLPVLFEDELIGIVSRTNVIEHMHSQTIKRDKNNIKADMQSLLSRPVFDLLTKVGELADQLHFKSYIIGGIVRDLLLGIPNEDIDIVIEGDAIKFAETFADKYGGTVKRHETFQTASVETTDQSKLDFTTSRTEFYKRPAALPTVTNSNIREDLYRRDFTMNAIAASLQPATFGDLIDYFNGAADIEKKQLRVLHNLSFVEDPTRILRGIRFEKRFSFKMDKETESFLRESISSISALTKSRISTELRYLFAATDPAGSIARMDHLNVLDAFLPGAVWNERTAATLNALLIHEDMKDWDRSGNDFWFITVLTLYTIDLDRLRYSETVAETKHQRKFAHELTTLLEHYPSDIFTSPGALHEIAAKTEDDVLVFAECMLKTGDETEQKHSATIRTYRIKRTEISKWITGDDLKSAGLTPGPSFKTYMFQIEQAVLNGDVTNREEALDYVHTLLD